jgi:hypothetical protein
MLVSSSGNLVRDQQYEAQIAYHNLPIKKLQLQTKPKQSTNGGQRYKQTYGKEVLHRNNRGKEVHFGAALQQKTIHDCYQLIFFTDEVHLDPSSQAQGFILYEGGTRTDSENIQERERGELRGKVTHIRVGQLVGEIRETLLL